MYASDTDEFARVDISGVVGASQNVFNNSGQSMSWCRILPETYDDIALGPSPSITTRTSSTPAAAPPSISLLDL